MNGIFCIFDEFVEQLVEDVLLVYVVRVGVYHHRWGSSSSTKSVMVQMGVVGVEAFEGVCVGVIVSVSDGVGDGVGL